MYYNINALVLNAKVAAEADKALLLYTREWGKISVVAPGAKKIIAKMGGATEPVMESQFMVYTKSTAARPKLTGARIVNGFLELRGSWKRMAAAMCCAEVVDVLSPYNADNEQKYDLLARTWQLLGTAENPARIFAAFALRFLKLSGYSFVEFIKQENVGLSVKESGAIYHCATQRGEDIDSCEEFDSHIERRMLMHISNYICTHSNRQLNSKSFLRAMLDDTEPAYSL